MPKLTIPERTYGRAIECLIDLYKKEPGFIEELQKIRSVYEPAIIKWLDSTVPKWRQLQTELLQPRSNRDNSNTLSDAGVELWKRFWLSIGLFYRGWNITSELFQYEKELRALAYRWKLKVEWTGIVLIINHFYDIVGITREDIWSSEASPEDLKLLLNKPPMPLLIFKVTSYELMYSSQVEIIQEFTKRLSNYAQELKSSGWKEVPSAIERHALWWFDHYVHGKKYLEIAGKCSPMVEAEGIKRAVSDFRKLLGIKIK